MSEQGRPRSEAARTAVLHAVDDMLVEDGYAAMTMKGIALRAGVGKQTVYRWWSNKAEILFEAVVEDASSELAVDPVATSAQDIGNYLMAVERFLTSSHAGAAYRALVGEAQHDKRVADLIRPSDPLSASAIRVLQRAIDRGDLPANLDLADAAGRLIGPMFFHALTGSLRKPSAIRADVAAFLGR